VARRTDGSINVPRQMLPETPAEELPALVIAPSDTDESNVVLVPPDLDVPEEAPVSSPKWRWFKGVVLCGWLG
jgi:hypothetical protein